MQQRLKFSNIKKKSIYIDGSVRNLSILAVLLKILTIFLNLKRNT